MQNDEQILLAALNRSGFPFQLGIDAEVANGFAQHGWTVLVSEHPYRSDLFDRGFVDSIFAKSRARVVVESKRWQGDWIFAVDKQAEPAFRARVFVAAVVDGPQTRPRWEDLELAPQSVESAVCVLRRGDSDSAETVEGIAANLAEATQMIGVMERGKLPFASDPRISLCADDRYNRPTGCSPIRCQGSESSGGHNPRRQGDV